jgi:hypothetical protein
MKIMLEFRTRDVKYNVRPISIYYNFKNVRTGNIVFVLPSIRPIHHPIINPLVHPHGYSPTSTTL